MKFEEDVYKLARSIKFKENENELQNKMKSDINKVKKSKNVFIKADKTPNIYEISPQKYKKMLHDNITTKYRKDNRETVNKINTEAAKIATKLELDNRITVLPENEPFLLIKDHKKEFPKSVPCRLINPTKSEIGKISKHYLEDINSLLRSVLNVRQWRKTDDVVRWFQKIENKENKMFVKFDIEEFYPNISEKLLKDALEFAQDFGCSIPKEKEDTIIHSRKSALFKGKDVWTKKQNPDFDVSMGSFDSAEVCELVGLFILHQLACEYKDINFGLYRDDGCGETTILPGPQRSALEKKIRKSFREWGFKIDIRIGDTETDLLDVYMDLKNNTFRPFTKPNYIPKYIHVQSDHPKNVIKHIPKTVNDRLCRLSANEAEFNKEKELYQNQLKESGFNEKLVFKRKKGKKKPRVRNAVWFNPPFSNRVKTRVGHRFLDLIDTHFPEENPLHKIINRKTVKISYSCSKNFERVLTNHNKKILQSENETQKRKCNCQNQEECPLKNECLLEDIVYKATVTTTNTKKTYIGMTGDTFKSRFGNHKQSFTHRRYGNQTKLASYVWDLKDRNINPQIKFEKVLQAPKFRPGGRNCALCDSEKAEIMIQKKKQSINVCNEIATKCPHIRKHTLASFLFRKERNQNEGIT